MERLLNSIKKRVSSPAYESINDEDDDQGKISRKRFSWLEYSIFMLTGIAMLWAWNMFLAGIPYFQYRFRSSPDLSKSFPPTNISVATVTSLASILVLTHLQARANYPKRVTLSLVLNVVAFTLLALSTVFFTSVSPATYFGFLVAMIFTASCATGICQNGLFAYAQSFGESSYTQAIMTGHAVAGVLPCIVQIVSVLAVPVRESGKKDSPTGEPNVPQISRKSAFAYFISATAVSLLALAAFSILIRRHPLIGFSTNTTSMSHRKSLSLYALFLKLHYLGSAVFLTFGITMLGPVLTPKIMSVHPASSPSTPRLLHPQTFIPLAFLFWNAGDLIGRLLTLNQRFASLSNYPLLTFVLSIARSVFVPLYLICNIGGRGALIESDLFYLFIVQGGFGVTNGYIGCVCMMGAGEWVEDDEREAAGGFMSLCLVAGLTVGSLCSFAVA